MLIAAATENSGGGGAFIWLILLAFGLMWLIVIRPQRRKQKLQRGMQSDLAIGDEILTAGGVYGRVTRIDDEDVRVEIAPNVEVRLARRAIAAQMTEPEPESETAEPEPAAESVEENPG